LTLLNKVQNDEVSDTTEDEHSSPSSLQNPLT